MNSEFRKMKALEMSRHYDSQSEALFEGTNNMPIATDEEELCPDMLSENALGSVEDVVNEVLHSADEDFCTSLDKLDTLIRCFAEPDPPKHTKCEVLEFPTPQAEVRALKKKTTLYLSEKTASELSRLRKEVQRRTGADKPYQISKSRLIDVALEIICDDFDRRGNKGLLMKAIGNTRRK